MHIERSSWSRHGHILEIPDVSREEALQYLNGRGIDDQLALQIYELVGGRLVHLKLAVEEASNNMTSQGMCGCSIRSKLSLISQHYSLRAETVRHCH